MVHHHYYNQRPFSSRPPQGFFSFIIITILLLFSLPFLALVLICVYCIYIYIYIYKTCVYTVSSLYRKSSEHTSLISHFQYAYTDTNIHTRATSDLETCTVSGFRSLAGPMKWNWHVDRRGFLCLLDRNKNIAPKFYKHNLKYIKYLPIPNLHWYVYYTRIRLFSDDYNIGFLNDFNDFRLIYYYYGWFCVL